MTNGILFHWIAPLLNLGEDTAICRHINFGNNVMRVENFKICVRF